VIGRLVKDNGCAGYPETITPCPVSSDLS